MEDLLNKGPDDLQSEVQQTNLCTACGMCVGLCPYIKEMDEKVAIVERCGRSDGRCYRFCPRTSTDISALDEMAFGARREDAVLGCYRTLTAAKAASSAVHSAGQYGGTASALIIHALKKGIV
ncbi:MAG: hypothetical protein HY801_14880, partial [Candidatus Lindowbacteria bacterium]|nr:hypothetical protein [Candidatus Lindowbacteria bacterium]